MGDTLDFAAIGNSLLTDAKAVIEAKASGFLKDHPDAEAFLISCTTKLGKLMVQYALESDPTKRADLKSQMDDYRDAIKEEALSIVVDVEATAQSTFLTVLETAGRVAIGLAPVLLGAV